MIKCNCLYDDDYKTEYRLTVDEFINQYKFGDFPLDTTNVYIKNPITFDIETTTYKDEYKSLKADRDVYNAFMYRFQFCIENVVVFGSIWADFRRLLEHLTKIFKLNKSRKIVIYVHNLSFEWQFIYNFVKVNKVFATAPHKVLKATVNDVFEFRCSYYLSNMSLSKFIENTPGAHYKKRLGDLDYRKVRTPVSELTETEQGYRYNDVRGLYEAIQYLLKFDDLSTIPMTSTGFVRRDCRIAMSKNPANRKMFLKSQLTLDDYELCKKAFRGGNTACNLYLTNQILDNVGSFDISSSYPYVMLSEQYPVGKMLNASIDDIDELRYYNSKFCTIGIYTFENIKIKKDVPIMYIPSAKCEQLIKPVRFNGRIMSAESITIRLTNVDFEIIEKQYNFDGLYIDNFKFSRKRYLPAELRNQILHYFELKSKLKGVKGSEYEYIKSKNKLNSIYGMTVTDILHDEFLFENGEYVVKEKNDISKYYDSRNNFLTYQWGVFVTAYARKRLQEAIDLVGSDVVYCDTDSVKYVGKHDDVFDKLNKDVIKHCQKNKIVNYVDIDGKHYSMGQFDKEKTYDKFITMGAKKYAYEIDGQIGVTVSGLSKKDGATELTEKGGLSAFRLGEVFHKSGRTVAYYNNEEINKITVDGVEIETRSNIRIVDTTYTLGITDTMLSILNTLDNK